MPKFVTELNVVEKKHPPCSKSSTAQISNEFCLDLKRDLPSARGWTALISRLDCPVLTARLPCARDFTCRNIMARNLLFDIAMQEKNDNTVMSDADTKAREQAIVDSLAGFCHALGQPATVLMSSVELLRMSEVDESTRSIVLDACMDAVVEIKNLLAEMKNRREYLAESYLTSTNLGGTIAAMPEWSERMSFDHGNDTPPLQTNK